MSVGALRVAFAAILAAASLGLAWACVRVAGGGVYAQSDPARALRWDPDNAEALSGQAVAIANTANTEPAFKRAAQLARRALLLDPLNGAALRVLALEAERQGQEARAVMMMAEIGRRTRRDTLAQAWLMTREFQHRRYAEGYAFADAILQRAPEWGEAIYPAMAATFEDPAARAALEKVLAAGPGWRQPFLDELSADAADSDALRRFFLSFKAAPSRLTDEETGLVIGRLINDGRYADAQATWREFLSNPAAGGSGAVYDGDFRDAPGAPPFNWGLASDASAVAERVEAPDSTPALYVRFPASEPTPLAEQLLVLPPGRYVLSGRVLYSARRPERLVWGVQCADGDQIELSDLRLMTLPAKWEGFEADFTVPAQACPGQWLQLGSRAEDDFGMVDAWFTDLSVRPAAASGVQ